MVLVELIQLAKVHLNLPDEAVDLTTVIRHYRNLIHPGKVKRLEKKVGENGAIVAARVVEIIVEHIEKSKRASYGFTAEQLWSRLSGGESALPIVRHLLAETHEEEVKRLLIEVLPGAYFDAYNDLGNGSLFSFEHVAKCHRAIFKATTHDARKEATRHLYNVYKTREEHEVIIYETHFLRGSDLQYLSDSEGKLIKDQLLKRVDLDNLSLLYEALSTIGPYLDEQEASGLVMRLIRFRNSKGSLGIPFLLNTLSKSIAEPIWSQIKAKAGAWHAQTFKEIEEDDVPF